ncbi:MAG: FdtA/QdtA family cupin domain-containing protein [Actinomycetota bacterium]|nr:FdtA/QdtA family cupin domain-containing protein [Actinomycetota bacterium]
MIQNTKVIDLPCWQDATGSLVAIEANGTIPFDVNRVYYIFSANDESHRGFHSHRNLEQLLICIHGSVDILISDGFSSETVTLNKPEKGLIIGPMVWREMMNFADDAVLLVLASRHYETEDYMRDFDEFVIEARKYFGETNRSR